MNSGETSQEVRGKDEDEDCDEVCLLLTSKWNKEMNGGVNPLWILLRIEG